MDLAQIGRTLLVEASMARLPLKRVLMRFLDRAMETCGANGAGAVVLHESPLAPLKPLESVFRRVRSVEFENWQRSLEGVDPTGEACRSGRPLWVEPTKLADLGVGISEHTTRVLLVPLLEGRSRVLGVLLLGFLEGDDGGEVSLQEATALATSCIPAFNRAILLDRFNVMNVNESLVGSSSILLDFERRIKDTAQFCDAPVLVRGERGTGKELVARALHCWSRRRNGPYVPVLSSAMAESLVADDFFGHEKNAFTGAAGSREGRFVAAGGGSLFLDEVGDLPASVQSALLRVLERGELSPIGRDLPVHVDVRMISATNRNLEELMEQGRFRRDLYDRLTTLCLEVPPLRERRDDIPELADFFLRNHCRRFGRQVLVGRALGCTTCTPEIGARCADDGFYEALQSYDWPGNVRELKNVVTRALVNSPDGILEAAHLPEHVRKGATRRTSSATTTRSLDDVIRAHIERVLACCNENQSEAARILGLPLSTMRNKMKRLGVKAKPRSIHRAGSAGSSDR